MNWFAIAGATLIPILVGFIWYHPKTFGDAWMRAAGLSVEDAKKVNMPLVFGLTLVFSVMIALFLMGIVIHQSAVHALVAGMSKEEAEPLVADFYSKFGGLYRSFGHGALHGGLAALFFALPVFGVNALFERKSFRYIAINIGYWVVTLALMGGVICQWG